MNFEKVTLTTMCAVINNADEWLFIDRKKDWCGLALLGGHIEGSESFLECVKREVFEEAGLLLNAILFKGIVHFFNRSTKERYLIFNYRCSSFSGIENIKCDEGDLIWIHPNQFKDYNFAEGMEKRFSLFTQKIPSEWFVEWDENSGYIETRNFPQLFQV